MLRATRDTRVYAPRIVKESLSSYSSDRLQPPSGRRDSITALHDIQPAAGVLQGFLRGEVWDECITVEPGLSPAVAGAEMPRTSAPAFIIE